MSQASSIPVLFHGDHLYLVSHNSEPFTPIKPIVQNMGLDWSAQHTKLRANKERWGMVIITIPLSGAGVQQMTCMPVRKLPAFMSSINPNKVKSELREKVILYQNECDDVLWKYWCDKVIKPEQEQPTLPSTITPDQQCTLHNMVKALVEKGGRSYYRQIPS